jgi:hypothetical protein
VLPAVAELPELEPPAPDVPSALVPPVDPAGELLQAQKLAARKTTRAKRMDEPPICVPSATSTRVAAGSRRRRWLHVG